MNRDSFIADNFDQALDAFKDCGWEAVLDDLPCKSYTSMSQALHEAATKADKDGCHTHSKVLRLLAEACSMMLSSNKPAEPFEPYWIGNGRRSIVPGDFTDSEIDFFAKIVDTIDDPLLRGRLADLVWYKRLPHKVKYALAAIDSYTQHPPDVHTWSRDAQQRWQRAIDLSRMIGKKAADRLDQIESSIIKALQSATTEDSFFSFWLADTLMAGGLVHNHSLSVAAKLESLASEFDKAGDFDASNSFYNASARWFKLSDDDERAFDMTAAEAEALVKTATTRVSSDHPSYGVAASFLEEAIQVYRSIPRDHRSRHQVDQQIQVLISRLKKYGKRALDEMATVSSRAVDVSEIAEQARDAVSGKPAGEALDAFANLHRISVTQLRKSAIKSLSDSSLRAIIPKVVTSHDGRVIAKTPGLSGTTPSEEDEAEVYAEMTRFHYEPLVVLIVQGSILPALDVLTLEHRLGEADFIGLARRSPIVPIGREVLFGKALAQGFNRDFATSLHLLAPQIEHMVRFHLNSAGVSTTQLDQDGIETEKGLTTLIDIPETEIIFGKDLTYEIKTLFCHQLGPNLRNNIAHGLLDDQQCHSVNSVYAWWFGLKLVFNTFWNSLNNNQRSEEQGQENEDNSV